MDRKDREQYECDSEYNPSGCFEYATYFIAFLAVVILIILIFTK